MERSLYTADSGRAGGGQINVVTKGGTSQFHGGLYEFFRNDKLNANTWSNNANKVNLYDSSDPFHNCTTNFTTNCTARIPPVRWNNFGFTFGGPVSLLGYNKNRNKTFFFYSQEWRKIITYTTFNPTLPTKSMLHRQHAPAGLHHRPPRGCPAGAAPVTQIPTNLFNANSVAYIKDIFSKLPLLDGTTTAATTAGFFPVKNVFNSRQEMFRIDHQHQRAVQPVGPRHHRRHSHHRNRAGCSSASVVPGCRQHQHQFAGTRRSRSLRQHLQAHHRQRCRLQLLAERDSDHADRADGQGQQPRYQPEGTVRRIRWAWSRP